MGRRRDVDHLPALLRRLEPEPGESLGSLLIRLAGANAYDHPLRVIKLATALLMARGVRDDILCPRRRITIRLLRVLTGLDTATLFRLTPHAFARVFQAEPRTLLWKDLPKGWPTLVGDSSTEWLVCADPHVQYCPACLADTAYHRLLWLPRAITCCVEHRCLLVQRCAACDHLLPMRSVIAAVCHRCHHDLRAIPLSHVAEDMLVSQRLLQAWFTGADESATARRLQLPDAAPHDLYPLVEALVSFLSLWATHGKTMAPAERMHYYHLAMLALYEWPARLYQWLDGDVYRLHQLGERLRGRPDPLGYWRFSHLPLLEATLIPYTEQRQRYVAQEALTKVFQMPEILIHRLSAVGLIESTPSGVDKDRLLIRRHGLGMFYAHWRDPLSLREAMQWLNLPEQTVCGLVRNGLLTCQGQPVGADNPQHWLCTKAALCACATAVERGIIDGVAPGSDTLSLDEATRYLEPWVRDSADVLSYVATEIFTAWRPPGDSAGVGGLRFAPIDLEHGVRRLAALRGWCDLHEAACTCNVTTVTILRWTAEGALTPLRWYHGHPYFERSMVWQHREVMLNRRVCALPRLHQLPQQARGELLTETMVAARLHVPGDAVRHLVELELLVPQARWGERMLFAELALQQFRQQYLVLYDVAERAQTSSHAIVCLVHREVLSAIAGPTINGCAAYIFRRDAVTVWLQNKARIS